MVQGTRPLLSVKAKYLVTLFQNICFPEAQGFPSKDVFSSSFVSFQSLSGNYSAIVKTFSAVESVS